MACDDQNFSSRLAEQAAGKGSHSYSYWAAGQQQGTGTFEEKKLTDEEAQEQDRLARAASEKGASVWNQAGTFEERNVTAWAMEQLAALLVGLQHSSAGASVSLTELTSATGEAHIWIMRSKKRAGFNFDIEVAWTASVDGGDPAEAKGVLKLPGVSSDDVDDLGSMLEVTVKERSKACRSEADIVKLVRGITAQLQQRLKELQRLLKEK